MDISDFLPKYPSVNSSKYNVLNPYTDNFYEAIFHKKEFYENKLDKTEVFPKEKGILMKYQQTIVRYLSSHTPYDRLLLVHFMGSGKCVLPDTVITANNKQYKIEDLWNNHHRPGILADSEGEWAEPLKPIFVNCYDETLGKLCESSIKRFYRQYIREPIRKVTLSNGRSIRMTYRHKLLTEDGWTEKLYVGTMVKLPDLEFVKIVTIDQIPYKGWVYDLEIDVHHNYVANGILTHNTCSAIGAIEQIRSENSTFKNALVLAKGETMLENFRLEIVEKCTAGQYIPANYEKLSRLEKIHRTKKTTKFYQMDTFIVFGKHIRSLSDAQIEEDYSNTVVVIDEVHNLRPQSDDDTEGLETYNMIHRFLHLIKNCKILLLSGTPMKDGPEEIASVANLLLPLEDQLPLGNDFLSEYMEEKDNVYSMIPEKADELKMKLKGMVSFLREAESSVAKNFIGDQNYGSLKHLIVKPEEMSEFQTEHYRSAYSRDQGVGKSGKSVWIHSREASLFVYPDGSYGSQGFAKYIQEMKSKNTLKDEEQVSSYRMTPELRESLQGETAEETLEKIRMHSVTYANVISNILETDGNCFIFSSIVRGSGAIIFSLLLELFGFSKAKGGEKEKALRYAVLSNKTMTKSQFRVINEAYNASRNMKGEYIKVIIGSRAVSEGFSFKNVIFEAINTPHWNYSETAQALARGIRLGSHNDLLRSGEKAEVNILQPVAIPSDDTMSIDLHLYEISEDKDISIHSILRLLMEVAFDCALNYMRNHVEGKFGTRECDYTSCDYNCDGIDMQEIANGVSELDYSTYQLYYANPNIPLVRRKIENLFRGNVKMDLSSILKNLSGQFTEEEIRNALYIIQEESETEEFDYRDFLRIYSRSPVKQLMNEIEDLFRQFFRLNLTTILEQFPKNTTFEVVTALQTLIDDSVVLMNKYGLPCYLREENDVYFLVNSLSIQPDFFTEYYTSNPYIISGKNFDTVMSRFYSSSLPRTIDQICKTTNESTFIRLLKTLPLQIQELFVEASLIAKNKKIGESTQIQEWVLKYFSNYIRNIDGIYVSTLLKEGDEVLRCLDGEEWKDCDERYTDLVRTYEMRQEQKKREENPYGLLGKYNPEQKIFCIVDFEGEKETQKRIGTKREKAGEDKRLLRSGKNCKSWHITDLIRISVKRLKLPPPDDFRKGESRETMLRRINEDKSLKELYSEEEMEELDNNDLRRVLYWGTPPKEKGMRRNELICGAIKTWMEQNDLLEIDMNCGVQGKKKIGTLTKNEKDKGKKVFRIDTIIPARDLARLSDTIKKDITKLMGECFGNTRYRISQDDTNTWVLVFLRKKLVGFITIDNENILWNVCVAKNYRRQGIAGQAMQIAVSNACSIRGKNPSLLVDNRNKDSNKLIRLYQSFGFNIDKTEGQFTYLSIPCEKS